MATSEAITAIAEAATPGAAISAGAAIRAVTQAATVATRAMTIPTTTSARPWMFTDLPGRFGPVQVLARKLGMLAAVFGSVVQLGQGRDLDVLMVPLGGRELRPEEFISAFGGTETKRNEKPERGIFSVEVTKGGRIYHFVFGNVGSKARA